MECQLSLIYEYQSVDTEHLFDTLYILLSANDLFEEKVSFLDREVSFFRVAKSQSRKVGGVFGFETSSFEVTLGRNSRRESDVLYLELPNQEDWDEWVGALSTVGEFVHSYVVDRKYSLWQNMKYVDFYERAGRRYDHLPLIHSGLPSPHDRVDIDISRNPGRFELKVGYIEVVAAQMWFEERFWELVDGDIEALKACSEIEITKENGLLHLDAGALFTDSTNQDLQVKLRKMLYGHR
jgi:hypothetical protein